MRKLISLVLTISSFFTLVGLSVSIYKKPVSTWVVNRTTSEIVFHLNAVLAKEVSPKWLDKQARIALNQYPRDWHSMELLERLSKKTGANFSKHILVEISTARSQDHSLWANFSSCVSGVINEKSQPNGYSLGCSLLTEIVPVAGDARSIFYQGKAYVEGEPFDYIDLSLSGVGLLATAAAPFTGASSYSVKVGSGIVKTAKRLGTLSAKLTSKLSRQAYKTINVQEIQKSFREDHLLVAKLSNPLAAPLLFSDRKKIALWFNKQEITIFAKFIDQVTRSLRSVPALDAPHIYCSSTMPQTRKRCPRSPKQ